MAGHSYSANIKFRKDRVDAARAKAFSKVARLITVAAKMGGGDIASNPRLRLAVEKARIANMPKDNVDRAIKKGTGEGDVGQFEEIVYEAYGPCGVAVMLDVLTDNRNRTGPEIRKLFERSGGNLGSSGSVAYMFERKSVFVVEGGVEFGEDRLMEATIEAGADDLVAVGDTFEIQGPPGEFLSIKEGLEAAQVPLMRAEVTMIPQTTVQLESADDARKILKLLAGLEEHDDVQGVSANYEIDDAIMAEIGEEL